MAEFVPFQGIRYNSDLIKNLADIVAPPYDVISAKEQNGFYKQHECNVIRLILGKKEPDDDATNNVHTRAANYFLQWIDEKILIRDPEPAFYITSVTFDTGEKSITRYGLIGLVRLEPFDKGIVLPHEKTFSKVKSERLRLMKACHANFSPIFGLYADMNGTLAKLHSTVAPLQPETELIDTYGLAHKLWKITNPQTIAFVTRSLQSQRIYIADGHHRYETALNYREWVKANTPGFNDKHPANYVMMSLISMEDPGLVVLPAHRLLSGVPQASMNKLFDMAPEYFDIYTFTVKNGLDQAIGQAATLLSEHLLRNAVGIFSKYRSDIYILALKQGVMNRLFGNELHDALLDLDVTVLTRLLMMELLGFDQERLDDETKISYSTKAKDAVKAVMDNEADVTFILNPTKIEQVRRVAECGLIMPRKSTYFYPKILSGHVMNLLR